MPSRARTLVAAGLISLLSFIGNAAAFLYCYNHLATPYINEGQRELNAAFIMSAGFGMLAAIALVTGVAAYLALARRGPAASE